MKIHDEMGQALLATRTWLLHRPSGDMTDKTFMNGESVYPDATPRLKVGEALNMEFTEAELRVLRELAIAARESGIVIKDY